MCDDDVSVLELDHTDAAVSQSVSSLTCYSGVYTSVLAGSETRYCFTCISHLQLFADKSLEINEQKVKLSITET